MAYFMLGERMSVPDIIFLSSVFCCVILVLLGANNNGEEAATLDATSVETIAVTGGALAFIGLMAQPVLIAG